jgi:hypothetical protein
LVPDVKPPDHLQRWMRTHSKADQALNGVPLPYNLGARAALKLGLDFEGSRSVREVVDGFFERSKAD